MSMLATGSRVQTETPPEISVRLDTPSLIEPELFATTMAASIDLVRVGGLLAGQGKVADGSLLLVRRVQYGSPYEIVFSVATSVGGLAAVAFACTKVLNGLADFRVKLATARKLTAETNEIRINQARKYGQDNWRAKEVIDGGENLEIRESKTKSDRTRYLVQARDGRLIEFDLAEIDHLEILQAEDVVTGFVKSVVHGDPSLGRFDVARFSAREIRSLILLSELRGQIEVREPSPHE